LLPHLGGHAPAAVWPEPDATGVIATRAEGTGAAGADPAIAALVAVLLLGQAFAELAHQCFQPTELLDLRLLLVGEQSLKLASEPVLGNLGESFVRQVRNTVPEPPEGAVEAVEIALVLDQDGACQRVELLDVGKCQISLQCG